MNRERLEMMERTYQNRHCFRGEQLCHLGNEQVGIRSYRSVTVCLVLLCVLLLTAVIVLCVLINTNNQQCHIKTKNLTEERDQLLTKYANVTEERDEFIDIKRLWEALNETDGWIYYQSSLYFISSEKKSWSESRRYCRERGADLIIINNKEEQLFVRMVTACNGVWIGLSDSDEEGIWKWVDGSTLISGFWERGEPNSYAGDEDCAVSYPLEWADFSCTDAFKWICEKIILS